MQKYKINTRKFNIARIIFAFTFCSIDKIY